MTHSENDSIERNSKTVMSQTHTSLDRMVLIRELTKRHSERPYQPLGKTALQKFVYFLQEVHGVECGYDFVLYNYGPYSALLQADLDAARALDFVNIQYDPDIWGYQITLGTATPDLEHTAETRDAVDRVLSDYPSYTAKSLELRATTVYAEREMRSDADDVDDSEIINVVHELKPHFNKRQIRTTLEELRSKGYVSEKAGASKLKRVAKKLLRKD